MADEYLFISDCHLDADRPDIIASLAGFLKNRAPEARFLYILGDLFETWIGDDDPATEYSEIFSCFKELAQSTELFFLAGNRDFLLHQAGAERIGAKLIKEPAYLDLGADRVALLHGDTLCTDDPDYQQFRKMVRGDEWQDVFLSKPLSERKQIVADLRQQSKAAMQQKSMDIMDVNQQAVLENFAELGVSTIIHGHTHRPAVHDHGDNKTRFVLGDWNPQPSYLSWHSDHGFKLSDYRV